MKNTSDLIKKTEELVASLKKTNNATLGIFEPALDRLKKIQDDATLHRFLVSFPGAAKMMDVAGYSREQIQKWEAVWDEAKKLRPKPLLP